MNKRLLGKSGIEVSPMGFGCWAIGGPTERRGLDGEISEMGDSVAKNDVMFCLTFMEIQD